MQVGKLAQQEPGELAKMLPHTSLLHMLQICSEIEAVGSSTSSAQGSSTGGSWPDPSSGADSHTNAWIAQHATNNDLERYFVLKVF